MGFRRMHLPEIVVLCTAAALLAVAAVRSVAQSVGGVKVVINEIVTDPQQDWNDSGGGNGVPFDGEPGNGTIGSTDEWVELFNAGGAAIDLTAGSGWTMEMIDTTPETLRFDDPGSAVLVFSSGGSVTNFQPGEYLVVGNPPGAINNDVYIVLKDGSGNVVDDVELGDDPEEDGNGDGAPDGGAGGGNATGVEDEAIARVPNAVDTDDDVSDFTQQAATIATANDGGGEVPVPDITVDPTSHDYGDVEVGSSRSQTFVISNDGDADLEVTATTLTGEDADQFAIDSGAAPFTVSAGTSHDMVVSFNPTSEGSKSAMLEIDSNDPDESPLVVALAGTGVAPGLRVELPKDAVGVPGSDVVIPIRVSDLTGKDVFGFGTVISFDEQVLKATGASTEGTVSEPYGSPRAITAVDGLIGVAAFGTDPLSGSGTLINLHFHVAGLPGETTELAFVIFVFNRGEPSAVTVNGSFMVVDSLQPLEAVQVALRNDTRTAEVGQNAGTKSEKVRLVWKRLLSKGTPSLGSARTPAQADPWQARSRPLQYELSANYPNPFNPETVIRFELPHSSLVRLQIYDLHGRLVRSLLTGTAAAGRHSIRWDGTDTSGHRVSSGVYLYRLQAGAFVQTRRMLLLR